MNAVVRTSIALVLVLDLAACGGGGGSSPASPQAAPPATVNVAAAFTAAIRSPHSYSLTGSSPAGALQALVSTATTSPYTYNGVAYDRATLTVSLAVALGAPSVNVNTLWFQSGTVIEVFEASSIDGSCALAASATALPTSAALNSVGPYWSGQRYPGCSKLGDEVFVPLGTMTETWSYAQNNGTGWVCINAVTSGAVSNASEANCFEVADAAGSLTGRVRIVSTDYNGVTTTLSN